MSRIITIATLLIIVVTSSYSQSKENNYRVNFAIGKSNINFEYGKNRESLDSIINLLNAVIKNPNSELSDITIDGNTSPEGGAIYNKRLSEARSNAIKNYILSHTSIDASKIISEGKGIAWDQLEQMVESSSMTNKEEVLNILRNIPEESYEKRAGTQWATLVDSRLKQLMELNGGAPYRYMSQEFFPAMRNSGAVTVHYEGELVTRTNLEPIAKATSIDSRPLSGYKIPTLETTHTTEPEGKKPIALKTNLLYDAVTAINLELEIPIGDRFSVMGEYIFPWWYNKGKNFTFRGNIAHLGVNYWLFDRSKRDQLSGWHVGVYGGYGSKYDVQQWAETGIQGSYLAAGANIGYAHKLWRNLNMEYQVGAGWIQSDYKNYTMAYDTEYGDIKVHDYPWLTKRYNWVGAIQAEVSLVWIINLRKERGGMQ